jgi:hypothetical protein
MSDIAKILLLRMSFESDIGIFTFVDDGVAGSRDRAPAT